MLAGRAGKGGGVKVERPQPKARTYDLDATAGRRTLFGDGLGQVSSVVDRRAPVFASGPSVWRWLRRAGVGARHLFVPLLVHDAIEAAATVGLNQLDDAADGAWGHADRRARQPWSCPNGHAASTGWVRQRISPSRSP